MKTSDFDYDLPQELIAQRPAEPRDGSRLMVVSRSDGSIQHHRFRDLPEFLRAGDVLVFNDSRVFPARLYGRRAGTSGKIELLLLCRLSPGRWRALVRPGRRMGAGTVCELAGEGEMATAEVIAVGCDSGIDSPLAPILSGFPNIRAEIAYGVAEEMVLSAADLLDRRLMLRQRDRRVTTESEPSLEVLIADLRC